ncbi:MAG: ComEC/Rec2 family competence protein, partial [Gemmatimonadota bacterium]
MSAAVWAAGARVRPLVRAGAAFCVGIAAGLALTPYPLAAAPIFVLVGVGVVSAAAVAARKRAGGAATGRRLLVAFLVAGAIHGLAAGRAAADHPLARLPDGAALRVAGTLEALPARDGSAWLVADSARAERAGEWRPLRARLRLRLSPGTRLSAALIAAGEWRSTRVPTRLPRRPARAGWLQVREARALDAGGSIAPRLRAAAQRRLRAWLGDRSGAAEAMLLARREALEKSTRQLFAAAGLSHLLAISGLHVGVVAGALLTLAGALRVRRRVGVVIAVAGVAGYAALLGFPHAATRAATQIALLLGARAFQRPADPYALLATAAFAILTFDPLALTEPGFQMSFAGVAGLIAWGRPLQRRLDFLRWRPARTAVAASVAATAATAPVAAWTFSQAAPIGLAANLVAIPVASLAVPTLAAALGVGWLWPDAGAFLAGAGGSLLA